MKKTTLLTIFLFSSFTILFAQDEIQKEKDLIKKVIQSTYVDGL
jgi:hypothetical protein